MALLPPLIPTSKLRKACYPREPIMLGDVARPNFTIVREDDVVFEVIQRIWRKRAVMAVVVRGGGVPRPAERLWSKPGAG